MTSGSHKCAGHGVRGTGAHFITEAKDRPLVFSLGSDTGSGSWMSFRSICGIKAAIGWEWVSLPIGRRAALVRPTYIWLGDLRLVTNPLWAPRVLIHQVRRLEQPVPKSDPAVTCLGSVPSLLRPSPPQVLRLPLAAQAWADWG